MSQANASDAPAPAAMPLIAPTIGFSSRRIATDERVVALADLGGERSRVGLEALAQVLARAERTAGAGEDHDADRRVPRDAAEGLERALP